MGSLNPKHVQELRTVKWTTDYSWIRKENCLLLLRIWKIENLYKSAKNMRWISKGYCENGSKSLGMKKEIELFSIHPLNILCEQDYF